LLQTVRASGSIERDLLVCQPGEVGGRDASDRAVLAEPDGGDAVDRVDGQGDVITRDFPSWYLVASQDKAIPPEPERVVAGRAAGPLRANPAVAASRTAARRPSR